MTLLHEQLVLVACLSAKGCSENRPSEMLRFEVKYLFLIKSEIILCSRSLVSALDQSTGLDLVLVPGCCMMAAHYY